MWKQYIVLHVRVFDIILRAGLSCKLDTHSEYALIARVRYA